MTRRSGFSLAELVIATTIVAVIASVAIPAATNRRLLANEACAVVALRDIASAQAKFQAGKFVDLDGDGVGEFGLLRELSGGIGVRTSTDASSVGAPLDPPLLPRTFGVSRSSYEVSRAGYRFRVVLPAINGAGVPEMTGGALFDFINSDLAETTWGCYAWPQRFGRTGNQTFFTNQTGDIVSSESRAYSGSNVFTRSNAGAAFAAGGPATNITGQLAIGTVGRDGNVWRLVTPRAEAQVLGAGGEFVRGALPDGHARLGGFRIESRQEVASARERLVVSVAGLREPGRRYHVVAGTSVLGTVTAGADGRANFRFDGRAGAYPAGVPLLADLPGRPISVVSVDGADRVSGLVLPFLPSHDPRPVVERYAANEAIAIASLREIAAAQTKFQASASCDVDGDGVGEFGLLRELTGAVGVRTTANASVVGGVLGPPLLPDAYRVFDESSELVRSGYLFRMVLPGAGGDGVLERTSGALAAPVDADLAETTWCCYAWPRLLQVAQGRRMFFINQAGDIAATDFAEMGAAALNDAQGGWGYTFTAHFGAGAAFERTGWSTNILGPVLTETSAHNGRNWHRVPDRPDEHEFSVRGVMTPPEPGSADSGTFVVESRLLPNETIDSVVISRADLVSTAPTEGAYYRLLLTDAAQVAREPFRETTPGPNGLAFRFDPHGDWHLPINARVMDLGGGTIDLRMGNIHVLHGTLPTFTTVLGPHVPGSSVVFHVAKPLDAAPNQLPRHGSLDVRVTNTPDGTREELTIEVTTYDRDADPYGVFADDAQDVATPLGTIAVRGLRGTGTLTLDTARGDVIAGGGLVALSGRRIEVRTPTGFVVLTGTLPVVE